MDIKAALKSASAICARQEQCKFDIRQKLDKWGLTENDKEDVLDQLEEEGFIDEKRYAGTYCSEKFRLNRWGRIKLKYMLKQKRLPEEIIENALYEIEDEEYQEVLQEELKKKIRTTGPPTKPSAKRKLIQFAQQRGFEYDHIARALSAIREQ